VGSKARWLTPAEAGGLLGVSGTYVRFLVDTKRLPARRTLRGWRFISSSALERFRKKWREGHTKG